MRLYELINGIADTDLEDFEVESISSNTKNPPENGLFVCIKGKSFDAHDHAAEMLEKGALAVVCERDLGLKNQIIVPDTRDFYSRLCAAWFGHPERELKIIGVTGTNGKTTITTVIKKLLSAHGKKAGLIGTCQNEIGDKIIHTERTTPETYDLFELLRSMADEGCEYVVMEASSQGLEQKRLGSIVFKLALFTNLTQDHLDVHGSMENYYNAKKLIFSMCETALINVDDEYGKRYYSEAECKKYGFSTEGMSDFYADCIKLHNTKSTFWFSDGKRTHFVETALPGIYNISNVTAVLAAMELLGFDTAESARLMSGVEGVRGRCEIVPTGRDFTVITDYAHTPDALENILKCVKGFAKGRVVCLFGCGGNRDAAKRPLMAKAAAKNADFLYITSDNPRNEDPEEIIKDILKGIDTGKVPHETIVNRKEAIFKAVLTAQSGDVIVLAGKGHEDYQILKDNVKIHFDEREVVAEALSQLK